MKNFDYYALEKSWGTTDKEGYRIDKGEPSEALLHRAIEIANNIFYHPSGLCLEAFGDTCWDDFLWYVRSDEELKERVKDVIAKIVGESD
jgi:hypothetical protein